MGLVAAVLLGAPCSPIADQQSAAKGARDVPNLLVTEWRRYKRAGHDAEDAARRGGWINVVIGGVGQDFSRLDREELADSREIRRKAEELGTEVKLLTRWRADVVGCDMRTGCDRDGFDPAWLRTVPGDHQAVADLREWKQAGYRIRPGNYVDPAWWERVSAGIPPGRHFIPYTRVDVEKREVRFHKVVADLCNAEYRAWAVAHARWQMDQTGADALLMANKMMWFPSPQMRHDRPGKIRDRGGLITDTPYPLGEYERCFASLIRELNAAGIPIVLNTNGLRGSERWAWMPSDVRKMVLGDQIVWR